MNLCVRLKCMQRGKSKKKMKNKVDQEEEGGIYIDTVIRVVILGILKIYLCVCVFLASNSLRVSTFIDLIFYRSGVQ